MKRSPYRYRPTTVPGISRAQMKQIVGADPDGALDGRTVVAVLRGLGHRQASVQRVLAAAARAGVTLPEPTNANAVGN